MQGVPIFKDPWLVKAPRDAAKLRRKERYALPQHYLGDVLKKAAPVRPRSVAFFAGSLDLTTMNIIEKPSCSSSWARRPATVATGRPSASGALAWARCFGPSMCHAERREVRASAGEGPPPVSQPGQASSSGSSRSAPREFGGVSAGGSEELRSQKMRSSSTSPGLDRR